MNDGVTVGTLDVALTALKREERRRLLLAVFYADDADTWVDLSVVDSSDDSTDRIALHHRDLPTLAEQEYVDWDRDSDRVRRGECFEEVEPLLRALEEVTDELPDELSDEPP